MVLSGKVAKVTGAGQGIGWGCAKILAAAGAEVVVVDINGSVASKAVAGFVDDGGKSTYVNCDVRDWGSVQRMIGGVIDAHGRLDILVNNAGTHKPHTIDSLTEEQWDGFISLNLKSQFLCIKAAVPHLRQTRGSIINMSSMTGVVGQPDALAYCATKGGILAMTKALAMDLAEDGVRVNAVCPAAVRTPLMEQWIGQQDDPDAVRELMNTMQPLGEMAEPEQIGDVVLFLASEASSFITGIHLPVDGGATLGY